MGILQGAESEIRLQFFDQLFSDQTGYLCIATKNPQTPSAGFKQQFFYYPDEAEKAEEFILRNKPLRDVYFCINLLREKERRKDNCLPGNLLWADLDEAPLEKIEPAPGVILKSSPGRHQGIWRLGLLLDPLIAENYSKRIAYKFGADKSGWDLTQLLRVPFTFNHKHSPPALVELLSMSPQLASPLMFEGFANPDANNGSSDIAELGDVPSLDALPPVETILYKYNSGLKGGDFASLYDREQAPGDDWSKPLWKLIHVCLEAGMTAEETFVIIRNSKLDKYERDQRPATHLWRDITKAAATQESFNVISANFKPVNMPIIYDGDSPPDNFVSLYRSWGEDATDAVADFHDLSAFILLSSVVANSVRLETSYGTMVPNLWGLILGDSTLTRKTTAMRMVMDILHSINTDMILATDGSAEGLLSGLEQRPDRTSIFFRDEVSGFFDSLNRKEYLAGMPEILTHLYDVPTVYQRRLRREIIRLQNPIFIFYGGGVRDKVYEVSTEGYILSGFIPRFLIVSGDASLDRLRRTGPANNAGIALRAKIVTRVADLYETYAAEKEQKIAGQTIAMPPRVNAILNSDAWNAYGIIEEKMVDAGSESSIPGLALPMFERFSRSLLKMAIILAAERQEPSKDHSITVEKRDIESAAWYGQQWGPYSIEFMLNAGKGVTEKLLDRIITSLKRNPGMLRSTVMQHHHLSKHEADRIFDTLEERMLIQKERKGRGWAYWAV